MPSFPRAPFLALRGNRRFAPDCQTHDSNLTKTFTFQQNRKASVASLRCLIGFLRNGDRFQSGMLIDFTGIATLTKSVYMFCTNGLRFLRTRRFLRLRFQ